MSLKKRTAETGQVALIMVLVMVIVGTISLSVISRSITNINLTSQEESKIRSFSAAEAGIEDLLNRGLGNVGVGIPSIGTLGSGANQITYSYKVDEVGSGTGGYELADPLANGDSVQIQLSGAASPKATGLTIYWNNPASLEISVYNQTPASVKRYAVNENGSTKQNGFYTVTSSGTYGGKNYQSTYNLTGLLANDSFVRIKALYNEASLAVVPTGNLPAQAYKAKVTSIKDESTAGVEVVQSKEAPPGIFDYVLWSGQGLP